MSNEAAKLRQQYTLCCSDLCYNVQKKQVLQNVSFIAQSGKFVALIGPCGAGKTSLLNCLSGRAKNGKKSGRILLNGSEATNSQLKDCCKYVVTSGKLLPYLTVLETLMICADLKMSSHSKEERRERVEAVIEDLGLTSCRDTYIGGEWKKGISTGEKKRICIAIELLDQPSVLIMDEPTSGLDSKRACELLSLLHNIAAKGRVVVISVHQPTSQMWALLDEVCLIAEGQIVLQSSSAEAKTHFESCGYPCPKTYNPSDFMVALVSGTASTASTKATQETNISQASTPSIKFTNDLEDQSFPATKGANIDFLVSAYKTSHLHQDVRNRIAEAESKAGQGPVTKFSMQVKNPKVWITETKCLLKRSFKNSIRNPIVCCVMLLVQALQGLILGGIFWQLTGDLALQQPYDFNSQTFVENPWSRLFIDGIDGRQPILDALDYGVDAHGSQPLLDVFRTDTFQNAYEIFRCGIVNMEFEKKGYTDFDVNRRVDLDVFTPHGLHAAIIGALQLLDYNYDKVVWSPPNTQSSLVYWALLTPDIGANFYDSFARCVGGITLASTEAPVRQLITIGDIKIKEAVLDLLGIGAAGAFNATKEIHSRARSCDHEVCEWIDRKSTETSQIADEVYVAAMALTNVLGALFFAVANLGFSSYDALLTFPQERALFNRESANGLYSASSYFLAKNLADVPFQVLPSFVLVTIFYFMVGLSSTFGRYLIFVIVCISMTFAAYGFGYLVSAASPRMEISVLAAPVILVIWLTIAGFFLRDDQIPGWIAWFSQLSFYKWGFFSLVNNQFPPGGFFGVIPNETAIVVAGITETRLWLTVILIIVLGLFYRCLAYIFLKYTNRRVGLET